jgi:hypothetical protein
VIENVNGTQDGRVNIGISNSRSIRLLVILWRRRMKEKLRRLNAAQYYIQLSTAMLFAYIAIIDTDPIKMMIAFLLLFGWSLGYYRHRIMRRRIRMNWRKRSK